MTSITGADDPVPLRPIVTEGPVVELLVIVNCPVDDPAELGLKCISKVTARPGFNVTGKVAPDMVKPAPVSAAALMLTGAVPIEVRVIGCVAVAFTATSPNGTLVALMLSIGIAAFNCKAKLSVTPPAVAVSVTVCGTGETVAVNLALVAPAATVTVAGTVTAILLLARVTVSPPLAAAAFSVTVQESLPDPVRELLLQDNAIRAGTPAPLRAATPVTEIPQPDEARGMQQDKSTISRSVRQRLSRQRGARFCTRRRFGRRPLGRREVERVRNSKFDAAQPVFRIRPQLC